LKNLKLIAKTFSGLEDVLSDEIRNIGGKNVVPGRRVVYYEGDQEVLYKSNYLLRTATNPERN
jgi:putative N6-adenine-specific DNA methylase